MYLIGQKELNTMTLENLYFFITGIAFMAILTATGLTPIAFLKSLASYAKDIAAKRLNQSICVCHGAIEAPTAYTDANKPNANTNTNTDANTKKADASNNVARVSGVNWASPHFPRLEDMF